MDCDFNNNERFFLNHSVNVHLHILLANVPDQAESTSARTTIKQIRQIVIRLLYLVANIVKFKAEHTQSR